MLTTGANSGIGLATALAVAQAGFRSVATVRSEAKAQPLFAAAEAADLAVEVELLEVTDADAGARLIERHQPYGVVNNAGINAVAAIEDTDDEEARSIMDVNVLAPLRLARLAVPYMRAQGGGRIINVSSAEGSVVLPVLGWYQASKHALEAASGTLRLEVARDDIAVCTVAPGGVDTAIYEKGFWADAEMHTGSRYADSYARLRTFMGANKSMQISSEAVARVILRALLSPHPRPRYLVGADARGLVATHNAVPAALRERLHRFAFAL